MKPIKLIIQAFGPFAQAQKIDFTQLGSNPLFLINGPTGSGKTSILDAICFALYGETTGNERLGMQMRSDLAPLSIPTEITLEFALNDKLYRVTRSPEQEAPKARGEGMTTRKHTAALYLLGEEETLITSKTAQVKTEITELLGLNETQFRQVMVLPQGKFRELLLASSKEREEIFGQLFQTDVYKRIEFALKDKASAISKAKNDFDNQIRGALQVAEAETEQSLDAQCERLKATLKLAESDEQQALHKLQNHKQELQQAKSLEERFEQLRAALQALESHQTKLSEQKESQARLNVALAANKLMLPHNQWQQSTVQVDENRKEQTNALAQFDNLSLELAKATQQLELQTEKAALVPKWTDELYAIETTKTKLVEKQQLVKEQSLLVEAESQQSVTLQKYQTLKQSLDTQAEEGKVQLEKARILFNEKPAVEAEIERLKRAITDVGKLVQLKGELKQQKLDLVPLEQHLARSLDTLTARRKEADQLEFHWHSAQAAVLAKKLQDDLPCPVCGSIEHPSPAQFNGDEISKQQVDAARQSERISQDEYNRSLNKLEQHKTLVKQTEIRVGEQTLELGELASIDSAILDQAHQEQEIKLRSIVALDLNALEQAVVELNQRSENGEAKITELKQQMVATQAQHKAMDERIESLTREIGDAYQDIQSADMAYLQLQKKIETTVQTHEAAKQHVNQLNVNKSSLEGQIKTLDEQCHKLQQALSEHQATWLTALESSQFNNEESFLNGAANENQVEHWRSEIESYKQTQIKLEQTVEDLKAVVLDKQRPNLDSLNQLSKELETAYQGVREALDRTRSDYERLIKVKHDIAQLNSKNVELEREYKVFGTLYDVASGKTGSRVSLHRFVLGVLLDDVLVQASQRLSLMSKGRYILMRKTEGFKGAAGRGLDLIVEDGYTGKTRDVATLSGGESFMAALSLALGLSDVVQSYSGGIRLDTLFIDEGFGSLDPESLDLAIQTLIDLQQSGRTIGLISHVSELKEQMSLRIDVEPTKLGSCVKLVAA